MQATLERIEHPLPGSRLAGSGFPGRSDAETALTPYESRLFSLDQRVRLKGGHPSRRAPVAGRAYVAGVALSERAGSQVTVAIGEVGPDSTLAIVQHYRWTQESPGGLGPRLLHLLGDLWGCRQGAIQEVGGTELLARQLRQQLDPLVVESVPLAGQGRLGLGLLAALNADLVNMYAQDGSSHWQEFWAQIVRARARRSEGGALEFYVEPSTDDDGFLISLALAVKAAGAFRPVTHAVPA